PEREIVLERQLKDIGRYAISSVCRHKFLCEYFGARYPDIPPVKDENGEEIESKCKCGKCDVCLGEVNCLPEEEARITAKKILSAVWRCRGSYGLGYIVDLLLGRASERMEASGHTGLKVFGILKSAGMAAVRYWADQLIVQGFIKISDDPQYPLASITEEGRALCRDERDVFLGIPVFPERKCVEKKRRDKALERIGYGEISQKDEDIFNNLRAYRRLIADRMGVPPYIIFHDSTLAEMATRRPKTLEDLKYIKGMGENKLEKYGGLFLEVLAGRPVEDMELP
ncbi:MAG: HRDC domain-containing protein, partial [Elusimicrobiales bacterium]|nr:HRDC domain-containing protein [Elusimicrobiales bacterium]